MLSDLFIHKAPLMITVDFAATLKKHVGSEPVTVDAQTLKDVVMAVCADHPKLREFVLDETGRVRSHITVFHNSTHAKDRDDLSDPVASGDDVFLFQAIAGG